MKSIGRIFLIAAGIISVICFFWVLWTPHAFDAKGYESEWMSSPAANILIWSALIFYSIAAALFIYYAIVDLIKHPDHRRGAIIVGSAIGIAFLLGFIFSSSDAIPYGVNEVYPAGINSKMIGAGIITAGILFVVCAGFLLWDTVKAVIKG